MRAKCKIKEELSEEQYGFKEDSGCRNAILYIDAEQEVHQKTKGSNVYPRGKEMEKGGGVVMRIVCKSYDKFNNAFLILSLFLYYNAIICEMLH